MVTQKFVAVRVSDGSEAAALQKSYQINAFPTLLVVDGTGAELDRHLGYLDGPSLVKELERILRGERTLPALAAAAKKAPDDVEAQRAYGLRLLDSDAKAAEAVLIALLPRLEGKPDLLVEAWLSLAKAASILGDEDRCLALHRQAAIEFVGTAAANQALLEVVQKFAYERRDVLAAIGTVLQARQVAMAKGQPLLPPPVELQLVTILLETAAEAFEKAVESEAATGAETKELALAGAMARLDPVRAAELGKKAVAKHPEDLPLLVTVARLLLEIGDVDEALPLAEKAFQKTDDDDEKAHLEEMVAKIKAVQAVRKAREDDAAAK